MHKCFIEMMSRNVIPTACHIQGFLFSERHRAVFAMRYIDKCWEIHRAFCRQNTRPPFEPTMKMRQFLWMLNDFKLLGKQLTASRLVEILFKDGPSLHDSSSSNLEQELVFLEFVEALLHCALVYVTSDTIKEQVDGDNQKRRNFRTEGFSEGTTNETFYMQYSLSQVLRPCEDRGQSLQEFLMDELEAQTGKDKEFDWWMYQVQIFFTNNLFPAYQHEKVLKAKIKENRIQNAELAELRRRKDEEIAKLIAEREAEDAKKQKEAAEEVSLESKSTVFKELEEPGVQLAPPPKEEASAVPAPAVTKVPTGTKRRRK
ncbi:radial spoke head 10 homolog B-like [Meleagris gallopavo]|uniref:radial spoke head 10 homolog B-like n=1 Tax=Meleagris gallopavo TaxID=9103 RepID=UPI000549D89E|nr:radial spoke head 10 homolog B-like [Meleagris gallopavo]XP_031411742.1 radial spoke head 10 homolog B-like [Meleagris gallopavo]